jgi:hypothetical protein
MGQRPPPPVSSWAQLLMAGPIYTYAYKSARARVCVCVIPAALLGMRTCGPRHRRRRQLCPPVLYKIGNLFFRRVPHCSARECVGCRPIGARRGPPGGPGGIGATGPRRPGSRGSSRGRPPTPAGSFSTASEHTFGQGEGPLPLSGRLGRVPERLDWECHFRGPQPANPQRS